MMAKNDKGTTVSDLFGVMAAVRAVAKDDFYQVVVTTETDSFGVKSMTVRTEIKRANPGLP